MPFEVRKALRGQLVSAIANCFNLKWFVVLLGVEVATVIPVPVFRILLGLTFECTVICMHCRVYVNVLCYLDIMTLAQYRALIGVVLYIYV